MGNHNPCGYWHKEPTGGWPTFVIPPIPLVYIPWYSCSQTVVYGNSTNDIFFATTDHGYPTDTLYLIRYNRVYGTWTTIYTNTMVWNEEILDYDPRWAEPPVAKASLNNIVVIGLCRSIGPPSYSYGLDIYVFDGETLISNYLTDITKLGAQVVAPFHASQWITIDNLGYIHVLKTEYKSGTSYLYDCISTDNGISFSTVLIGSVVNYTYHQFITSDSSGNIWVFLGSSINKLYKSANNGLTWNYISTIYSINRDFKVFDGVFYSLGMDTSNTTIKSSTDGVSWETRLTVAHVNRSAGILGYDGVYYYGIFNYRDITVGGDYPDGHNHVYRSNDGIDWEEVSTFVDNKEANASDVVSMDFSYYSGSLLVTYYYAETLMINANDVHMLCVWESVDNGITWVNIQTPFYDLTSGSAP